MSTEQDVRAAAAREEHGEDTLWGWSLHALGDAELRRAALTLQDAYRVNAGLVLWSAWTGLSGLHLEDERAGRMIAGVRGVDRYVVRRLREARRFLASPRAGYEAERVESVRREVYQAELAGERLILRRLERETLEAAVPGPPDADRAAAALRLFALCRGRLETPVLLADDLGAAGPEALFGEVVRLAPPPAAAEAG